MRNKDLDEQYNNALSRIEALVAEINLAVKHHAKNRENDPPNYGYLGDLLRVIALLEETSVAL